MALLFTAGEKKVRPNVYYRYSAEQTVSAGAMDGVNAIVLRASWGPTGTVTAHETAKSIIETYGNGAGVDAALAIKSGGAEKIYICRPEGTGGAKGTVTIGTVGSVTAKYVGARALTVKIQAKPGDTTKKQVIVLDGTTQLEKFEFTADTTDETAAFKTAMAESTCIDVGELTAGVIEAGEYKLTGGTDPTLTAQDYLAGFYLLEPYRYNVLSTDSVEETVAQTMLAYAAEADETGKMFMGVVGSTTETDFAERCAAAKAFNEKRIIYMGSGYVSDGKNVEGAVAINYTAGVISSTPANQSIVHTVVSGATDVIEKLTNSQYEQAIESGLLLLSIGPDGQVWYDSGINTLITPADNEDDGWKKIKRTKIRFELFDRIDRATAPLVGTVNCDADGIAAIIQVAQGVITEMIAEGKLHSTATIVEDPENLYGGDSAWFVIQADDIDSVEKIYLHYQFRYSQNA